MSAVQSSSPARKLRGRPRGQASDAVRDAILDEAEARFAAQGFAATPVREIASAVGVNSAMVNYYFGSKFALLCAVMERTLEPLADAIAEMKEKGHATPTEISRLLSGTISKNPNLPVLMVREIMLPGGAMQEHFLQTMAPRLAGAIPGILENEKREGRLPPGLKPEIVTLLLLALSVFPFIVRGVAEKGLGVAYDEAGLEYLEQHVSRLLEGGLSL